MSELVSYALEGGVATATMDDGKANAMSPAMLGALHSVFERAENDDAVVLLTGRPGIFSAGFDLKVFSQGREATLDMLRLGATLIERILEFPSPVVTACTGHAYPMGAFLMLSADRRLGTAGTFKIGMNEVAIGLTLPLFAIETARQRLAPAYFQRCVTGEMYGPDEAVLAGFLDEVVPAGELMARSMEIARSLVLVDRNAHRETKKRLRAHALAAIRAAIESELTA